MSDILHRAETIYGKLDFETIQTRTYWTYEGYFEAAKMLPELIAEIKKLEAVLIEERIAGKFSDWIPNQCPHWDIDIEPFCTEIDEPCGYRGGNCPIKRDLREIAAKQLHEEGKIGTR